MASCNSIKRKLFALEDRIFELRSRCQFSVIIKNEDLVSEDINSIEHATFYSQVWCKTLRELFKESDKTSYQFENFIDIGSGKGKACFYAHSKRRFKNITGVEFSKPLVDMANANKAKMNAANITFLHLDTGEFELPNQNCLIFMYNPFDNMILEKFILNNLFHFMTHQSVIAYANDVHRMSLTKFGFETIFRNQTWKTSLFRLPPGVKIPNE